MIRVLLPLPIRRAICKHYGHRWNKTASRLAAVITKYGLPKSMSCTRCDAWGATWKDQTFVGTYDDVSVWVAECARQRAMEVTTGQALASYAELREALDD